MEVGKQAEEDAGVFGQVGEEVPIVFLEPVVEGTLANVLHGMEDSVGDQFAI